MTNRSKRQLDRAIRQYQQDHPGTSLSAARRAVERHAEELTFEPRRLAIVPAPRDGESLASWVDRVAADNRVGRHEMMKLLGLEPGRSAAARLHQLSEHMPDRTAQRLYTTTGLRPELARAMAAIPPEAKRTEVLPFDEVVEYLRDRLERERRRAEAEGLPASAGWSVPFIEPQITQFGGAQALRKAAKSAARRLRMSVRVTIYRSEGAQDQLITVNNQGPYKTVKGEPKDTVAAVPFTLDTDAGPSSTACDCGRGYCLSGSTADFGWSPWPEPVWYSIRPDTDLRTLPEEYRTDDDMHLLFARLDRRSFHDHNNVLDLTPFLEGAELGPLTAVQVYATNARGQYRGSSHGAMCRHAETRAAGRYGPKPSQRHEILTLAELVEILRPLDQRRGPGDLRRDQDLEARWCVYCHGYSVRRFTADQCAHYRAEHERWSQREAEEPNDPEPGTLDADPMIDLLTAAETALQSPRIQRIFDAHDRQMEQQAQQTLDITCPHCSAAPGSGCIDPNDSPVPAHQRRRMAADREHGRR